MGYIRENMEQKSALLRERQYLVCEWVGGWEKCRAAGDDLDLDLDFWKSEAGMG